MSLRGKAAFMADYPEGATIRVSKATIKSVDGHYVDIHDAVTGGIITAIYAANAVRDMWLLL